jgi:hypothetical protein
MTRPELDEAARRQADDLISQLELASVYFDRVSGEIRDRAALDVSNGTNIPVRITVMIGHRYEDRGIVFRHEARVAVGGTEEEDSEDEPAAAIVEASIIVQFRSESKLDADDEAARSLGQRYSHMVMYPYLRELVHTTLARLGVSGATLGLFKAP